MNVQMEEEEQTDGTRTIQSIERVFTIIEALDEYHLARVSEIAEYTGIPESTVCFHLKTLEKTGHVLKRDGRYCLTLRFLQYGGDRRYKMSIFQSARREIDKLAHTTNLVVDLCAQEGGQCVLLYTANGTEAIDDTLPLGKTAPLHEESPGKVILASLVISEQPLPHTYSGQELDMGEIERILDNGIHITKGTWRQGLKTITFPLSNEEEQEVHGALSVSGLITDRMVDGIIDTVEKTANTIKYKLNYREMYSAPHWEP